MGAPRKLVTSQKEEHPDEKEDKPYEIEKILQKRIIAGGIPEYYVKWKDYPDEDNTWQRAEDIVPEEILHDYEANEKRKLKFISRLNRMREKDPNLKIHNKKKSGYKEGFDRGFSPERIIGSTVYEGGQKFLIKWKAIDDADLVSASEANEKCPELVIDFYQKHMKTIPNTINDINMNNEAPVDSDVNVQS